MLDDLANLAVAVAIDITLRKAAKKHRWLRIVLMIPGLFFLAFILGLVYITFKYS